MSFIRKTAILTVFWLPLVATSAIGINSLLHRINREDVCPSTVEKIMDKIIDYSYKNLKIEPSRNREQDKNYLFSFATASGIGAATYLFGKPSK